MKIAVIGGGAAGLMAAATIKEFSPETEVFLIEKNNQLGKKVIISGGGRCNLTTGWDDIKLILSKYPRGGKFLTKAMYNFPPQNLRDWFTRHNVPIKTESDMRCFPISNDGHDIIKVFKNIFAQSGVKILLNSNVQGIKKLKNGFTINIKNLNKSLKVDKIILTTGGQAYKQTGSTGDGYSFAQSLGHTISALAPSLSAFYTKEEWPAQVAGLSFTKARLTAISDKRYKTNGPFIFTHKGISGPAVFAMSSITAFEVIKDDNPLRLSIDLFPDTKEEDLLKEFKKLIDNNYKKSLVRTLALLIPKSLAVIILNNLNIDSQKESGQTSKKDLNTIINQLKHVPLSIKARAAGDEFVTAGGVNLNEVDPSTMESKKSPGLFLAGEILDIDGFTGGFNLQSAWATGRLAGIHVLLKESK